MHYLGIDVGKRQSTWYAADERGKRIGKGTIDTSVETIASLVDKLMSLQEGVEVAIEAGNVTFGLARRMEELGADVFVVHPLDNALIAQSRKKTDPIDAKTLCEQRRREMLPPHPVHVPSSVCEDLRHLVTSREALVDQRTAVTNRTLHILARYAIFPAKRIFKSACAWKNLRQNLGPLRPADELIVRQHINEALLIATQVSRFEKELTMMLRRNFSEEDKLVRSIPGIGLINTASHIAWGHPIERFPTARHYMSYVGLVPSVRQSGSRRSHGGTTRSGNRHLGRALVQAALSFSCSSGPGHQLWRWYEKVLRKRGWKKARVALARKLAAVVYGVLKHRKPYDPAHIAATLQKEESSV